MYEQALSNSTRASLDTLRDAQRRCSPARTCCNFALAEEIALNNSHSNRDDSLQRILTLFINHAARTHMGSCTYSLARKWCRAQWDIVEHGRHTGERQVSTAQLSPQYFKFAISQVLLSRACGYDGWTIDSVTVTSLSAR